MIHLKVKLKLYPAEFAGMVAILRRAGSQPPSQQDYADQLSFMADLTVYSVLLEYHRKLGCSVTPDRWKEKPATKADWFTMPTPVVIALWRYLKETGPETAHEQEFFSRVHKELVDGQLMRFPHQKRLQLT